MATHSVSDLTWDEVERRLTAGAPAILPIGAVAKQHGLHLPMNTDQVQAEWLAGRLAAAIGGLIWPTLTYGYYPAFAEYAGSCGLSASVFEAGVAELVAGLLEHGARAVLILDTGISTIGPVERAIGGLAPAQVGHLRIHAGPRYRRAAAELAEQAHGGHADELETSRMLALAPELVDMTRARPSPPLVDGPRPGALTRHDPRSPNFSPSGSFGDPTLATRAKGERLLAAMVADVIETAEALLAILPDASGDHALDSASLASSGACRDAPAGKAGPR